MSKNSLIFGCGALNWDIFFEVEDLEKFSFEGFRFFPGEEYVLERKAFFELYEKLKKEATFLAESGGGSSANTIFALSNWGFRCAFIGAVGNDPFGEKILNNWKALSVETSFILKEGETSLALILLDKKRDRSIIVSPGSAENYLSYENLRISSLRGSLLHLSSYASKEGEIFQKNLLNNFEGIVSFDPGEIYAKKGKAFLKPFLEKTKYLFITDRELQLARLSPVDLLEIGVNTVFIKLGKRGAMALKRNFTTRSSVYPAEKIVDNTGAGDYFNAGVLAGLLLGLPVDKALDLGLYSASMSLRNFGRKGLLSYDEFKIFLSRLK